MTELRPPPPNPPPTRGPTRNQMRYHANIPPLEVKSKGEELWMIRP